MSLNLCQFNCCMWEIMREKERDRGERERETMHMNIGTSAARAVTIWEHHSILLLMVETSSQTLM